MMNYLNGESKTRDLCPAATDPSTPAASATFSSHSWLCTGNDTWFTIPRGLDGPGHNPFLGLRPFSACVACPVPSKEAKLNPKAFAALERSGRSFGTWAAGTSQRYANRAAEAKRDGVKVHVGRIFDIYVKKNHELNEDDPQSGIGTNPRTHQRQDG